MGEAGPVVVGWIFGIMRDGLPADRSLVVVLDGPAGAGKTTIARALAKRLGLSLLDTGAIYRTLALAARRGGVDWSDEAGLAALCEGLPIRFENVADGKQRVLLDGEDVSAEIRTPELSSGASIVSAHPQVRARLLGIQRTLAREGCVAEGRDMGTVVFPDAPFKFFVTASPRIRASRRRDERLARGDADVPALDTVQRDLETRDMRDTTRATAPLTQADDAHHVDTSSMGLQDVIEHMLAIMKP